MEFRCSEKGPFFEQPENGNVTDLTVIVLPLNFPTALDTSVLLLKPLVQHSS